VRTRGSLGVAVRALTVFVLGAAAVVSVPLTANAVQSPQPTLVRDRAVDWTPAIEPNPDGVEDAAVRAIAQVGSTMVIGGTFTKVVAAGTTTVLSRPYILAFDARTGELRDGFQPQLDGRVNALVAGDDGQSVYVGGDFTTVDGLRTKGFTKLRLDDGSRDPAFHTVAINGKITDLRVSGGRLWLGGSFTKVAGHVQSVLATVDAQSGDYDAFGTLDFAGTQNGGTTALQKLDVTPDGSKLLAIGNWRTVNGLDRPQIALLDLTGSQAAVAPWQTGFYSGSCYPVFDSYMRDLDISPDGSYAVVSTTGGYISSTAPCDTTARWELGDTGAGLSPTWVDYTGGDTTYAVGITGTAVYVGGHMRWENNPFAGDRAGAGAVAREGIAALDPVNGLPLDWNPGRARGVGVFDFLATPEGLWVGDDTDRIGGWEKHPKLAFFPLAGGSTVPATTTPALPGDVLLAGHPAQRPDVLFRVNAGGPQLPSLDGGPAWAADTDAVSPYRNTGSNAAGYASGARLDDSVPVGTPGAVFDSERWDPSDATEMQWAFPVPAGRHVQVRLYLANRCGCTSAAGQRAFDVSVDGTQMLSHYDIVADVGDQVGEMKSFDVTSDGSVDVAFGHEVENPLVNAIEIIDRDAAPDTSGVDAAYRRSFDGTTASADTAATGTGVAWSHARGAVVVGDKLYTGWDDGGLYERSIDGGAFGPATAVDGMDQVVPLTAFHDDVRSTTAMFYDSGRLYYALAGQGGLYYRYFTPSSRVVGGVRFTVPNSSGLSFASTSALLLSGDTLYVGDSSTGDLRSLRFADGAVSGSPSVVSGPSTDGRDWRGNAVFVATAAPTPPPNQPPTADFGWSCDQLACAFDAGASSDPDGDLSGWSWTFGDGGSSTEQAPHHEFSAPGSYAVTLMVTDDGGATASVTRSVSATQAAATSIDFVGSATSTANARRVRVQVPPTVQAGDGLVLVTSAAREAVALTAPAGWTERSTTGSDQLRTVVWQRVADASSAGSTVTVTLSARSKVNLTLAAYHGTDPSSPVGAVTAAVETVKRAAHTTPTTTLGTSGSWVLSYWADATTATTAWSAPADQQVRATQFGTGGGHVSSLLTDDGAPHQAGVAGGLTATASSSNVKAQMLTIVLAPVS
jgi:PKD repeat protein